MALLSRDEAVRLAEDFAARGFLCSEAVLLAMGRALNVSCELIPKMATGFGAGVGRRGEVCGALSGAVMGLGIRFGRDRVEETQGERRPYWFAAELADLFRGSLGGVRCMELLGLDLSDERDLQKYRDSRMWETRCREIIATAAGLAHDILIKYDPES